ncbi:MAG TPA: CaiB/BaiF CoA-transferase family protein [Myxococcales bacterium]|nr:CaiB/BaiF CoA-transferase family protein [Myxococcales bacterium]
MTPPGGPLGGLRILDLTRLLPGPYATLVLADLGADVVKVEEPEAGDYCRALPPLVGDGSALFHLLNRNKRSIALDLKKAEGREVLFKLLERFDVVVESFRPGVMDRLGVGYDALRHRQPRVILCSISGYGQDGPYRLRAGHDVDYQALGGLLATTAAAPSAQIADIGGGAWPAALGLLAAAYEREHTGQGRRIDISMTEGVLAFLAPEMGRWAAGAKERAVLGGTFPCYRLYRAADGRRVALGALEPKFWAAFCEAIGRPEWIAKQWDEGAFVDEVEALFATRPSKAWLDLLAVADCCCEPVLEQDELFEHPLHVERGAFFKVSGLGAEVRHVRTPVRLDGHEIPRGPPPRLGQHTAAVLAEGGFDAQEIQELERRGAIRCPTRT